MRQAKAILIFILIVFSLGCERAPSTNPRQSVYLIKDKDGLYRYDFKTRKETLILKAEREQIFLDEPLQFLGDTMTIGFKGGFFSQKDTGLYNKDTYYKIYWNVDLKTGRHWVSKKMFYETHWMEPRYIQLKTQFFATNGNLALVKDTSMKFESESSTYKGPVFNDGGRFFSKSTVGNKTVYSQRGDVYLAEGGDTTLLAKFYGNFDPKFGCGYLSPQVDPTGTYVLVVYAPGAFHFLERESLKTIDLKSREMNTVRYGAFGGITFSNDGSFLLFKRNEREGTNDTWLSDIFILDLHSGEEYKIGEAYSAQWSNTLNL